MKTASKQATVTVNNITRIDAAGVETESHCKYCGGSGTAPPLDGTHEHDRSTPLMLISVHISIPGAEPIK